MPSGMRAVLRSLLNQGDPAQRLFRSSDLDIFVCARHEDPAAREAAATELARQICAAIGPRPPTAQQRRRYSYCIPILGRKPRTSR